MDTIIAPPSGRYLENRDQRQAAHDGGIPTSAGGVIFSDTTRAQGGIYYDHTTDTLFLASHGTLDVNVGAAGNVNALNINTNGNSGFGTTTPWGKLSVTGSGTGTGLAFAVADSSNSPKFVIQDNGNVGIGTTSPAQKLYVGSGYAGFDNGYGIAVKDNTYTNRAVLTLDSSNNLNIGSVGGSIPIIFNPGGAEAVRITASGNVGIGTTTPENGLSINAADSYGLLHLVSSVANGTASLSFRSADDANSTSGEWIIGKNLGGLTSDQFSIWRGGAGNKLVIDSSGNVGIGTSSPSSRLTIWGTNTASTTALEVVNSASTTVFAAYNNGNATYSGSIFQSSDQRLKTDITSLNDDALSSLLQLNPVTYTRIDQPDQGTTYGFIAQEVQQVFPELVTVTAPTALTPDGTRTLNYVGLISPLVKAVQEIARITGAFRDSLIAWLGDAGNGIGNLFAKEIYATNVTADFVTANRSFCAKKSDGSLACVTGDQLASVLAALGQMPPGSTNNAPSSSEVSVNGSGPATSTPPVIELNGNASSAIEVGDTYQDLGARISGPESDLNLGITTLLDGATTTQVSIDTTAPGEHTVLYTVTSPTTGLTGTIMRTVIVSLAVQPAADFGMTAPPQTDPQPSTDNAQPANDNPFNTPAPANDNASSTTAVDTAA